MLLLVHFLVVNPCKIVLMNDTKLLILPPFIAMELQIYKL